MQWSLIICSSLSGALGYPSRKPHHVPHNADLRHVQADPWYSWYSDFLPFHSTRSKRYEKIWEKIRKDMEKYEKRWEKIREKMHEKSEMVYWILLVSLGFYWFVESDGSGYVGYVWFHDLFWGFCDRVWWRCSAALGPIDLAPGGGQARMNSTKVDIKSSQESQEKQAMIQKKSLLEQEQSSWTKYYRNSLSWSNGSKVVSVRNRGCLCLSPSWSA